MSRCGRTSHLESLLRHDEPELRAHAKQCALCRHELNWLESEAALFRQRAGRDEVAHLWSGVVRQPPRRRFGLLMAGLATAAAVLLLLAAPRTARTADEGPLETDALMSPALNFDDEPGCSRLPSGLGFTCQSSLPASVLASR